LSDRVGLDARLTPQMSAGMQAYAREVAARLPNVAPEYAYTSFTRGRNFGWDEQVRLPRDIRKARVDLVHFLALYVPVIVPQRFVVTIHDLIHLHFPGQFKAKVGPYYRTVVRLACARAARVITDDERTVDDLVTLLGVRREKIRVVALGVAEAFFAPVAPYTGPRPYVLYVGNHRRHKDLPTLFTAWSSTRSATPLDLYLTGGADFSQPLPERADGGRIVLLGDVSDERLVSYYAGARALVQPSLREGFGLPVLEAMASGCPVIATEEAVAGAVRAWVQTYPAANAAALRVRLEATLDTSAAGREEWVTGGRDAARRLSWDACARATADVYREVLGE
jgi:glycosyltransferase involved in cell wall biosynthesis